MFLSSRLREQYHSCIHEPAQATTSPTFLTQMQAHVLREMTFLDASMINRFLSARLVLRYLSNLSIGPDRSTINPSPNARLVPKSRRNLLIRLQSTRIILVQLRPVHHPQGQIRHGLVLLHHRYPIAIGSHTPLLRHLQRLQSRNFATCAARKTIMNPYLKWLRLQHGIPKTSLPWK